MGATTGAWVRSYQPVQTAPLVSDRNPEHANPTPDPNHVGGGPQIWQQTAVAPDLPAQLLQPEHPPLIAPGGPVDMTPQDHGYGTGIGPAASEAQATAFRNTDQGEVAAHHWTAMKMRDGQAGILNIPDMIGNGDSPQTLPNQRMGVGEPADPAARRASMWRRYWNRLIDFHRYDVQYRPEAPSTIRARVATYAGAQTAPAVPNTPSVLGYSPGPPDRFVAPFTRRTPGPWDQNITTDGTGQPAQALTSWGL